MEKKKRNKCFVMALLFVLSLNAQCPQIGLSQDSVSFQIPKEVESDLGYNKLLGRYVLSAMKNESCDALHRDSLMSLYVRSSFEKTIMYLCDSANYANSNFIYEDVSRWVETLPNLLSYCSNKEIQYALCDSLLNKGCEIGLLAMWDSCDINRLENYRNYRDFQISQKNAYLLGDLLVISHNSKNKKEYKYIIRQLRRIDEKYYLFLRKQFNSRNRVTYYEYLANFNDYLCN